MSLTVEEERARRNPTYYLKMLNPETRATLEELYQQEEFKVHHNTQCIAWSEAGHSAGKEDKGEQREAKGHSQNSGEGVKLRSVCKCVCRRTTQLELLLIASRPLPLHLSQRMRLP